MSWFRREPETPVEKGPIDELTELAAETRRLAEQLTDVAIRLRRAEDARHD